MSIKAPQRGQATVPGYMYDSLCAELTVKDAEITRLKAKIDEMDQVMGLVCQDCGWAMKFPDEPCQNCECAKLRKVVEAAKWYAQCYDTLFAASEMWGEVHGIEEGFLALNRAVDLHDDLVMIAFSRLQTALTELDVAR